jgi:Trypsin
MFKQRRAVGWRNALSVATFVVFAATMTGGAGVASAAGSHHRGLQAWLDGRGVHVHRSYARRHVARAAIVGGSQISIEQARWQATVLAVEPTGTGYVLTFCGGTIIDATRIVTAAQCIFNEAAGTPLPAEDIAVVAGISNLHAEHPEPGEQFQEAAGLRVHPDFNYSAGPGSPDDLAVLTLSGGLALSSAAGSAVGSIGLIAAGDTPAENTHVNLTGFGRETPGAHANGTLNSLGFITEPSEECGGEADAVFICAGASGGSACAGDAGSGLTTAIAEPALIGVMDTVPVVSGAHCHTGVTNGFVNLAAPEIRDFIEGDPSPPMAPRGGSAIVVRGIPKVGNALTCNPGSWSNQPTITYLFVDSSSGLVLQSGSSSTYQLSAGDVGRTIFCEVHATNTGGTGVVRTTSLRAIEPAPSSPQLPAPPSPSPTPPAGGATTGSGTATLAAGGVEAASVHNEGMALLGRSLTVQSSGMALAKLDCKEIEGCNGVIVLKAKQTVMLKSAKKKSHTVTIGTANFSLSAGQTAIVKIHLNATGRALLSSAHGRLAAQLVIEVLETPTLNESVHLLAQRTARGSLKKRR